METLSLSKLSISIISLFIVIFLSGYIKTISKRFQEKNKLSKNRYFTLKRLINIFSIILLTITFAFIWGIDVKNLWVGITSILAMIAVAFFAIWSLVGNILAGIIIFFTSPFKINDTIEILPDNITGKVIAINSFFTLLKDAEENYISIPNSLFFQKYVKKIKKKDSKNKPSQ